MDLALVVVAPLSADGRELRHSREVAAALAIHHDVHIIDLVAEGVTPAMSTIERTRYETPDPLVDPMMAGHADLLMRARTVVFVFPTEWWAPPPIVKAWIERVFVPGVAFVLTPRGKLRPNLQQLRSVGGVTTHAQPEAIALAGDGARRMLLRTLRLNAPRRVRTAWLVDPGDLELREQMSRL